MELKKTRGPNIYIEESNLLKRIRDCMETLEIPDVKAQAIYELIGQSYTLGLQAASDDNGYQRDEFLEKLSKDFNY